MLKTTRSKWSINAIGNAKCQIPFCITLIKRWSNTTDLTISEIIKKCSTWMLWWLQLTEKNCIPFLLIVSKNGHVGFKGLLCYILIKWYRLTDMIKCRNAIAFKKGKYIWKYRMSSDVYLFPGPWLFLV